MTLFDSSAVNRYLATMRNNLLLLAGVIILYLVPSLILQGVYGPSYGFMSGDNYWSPDGKGGWMKHGAPDTPAPVEASVDVPVAVRYIPIFLPAILLILFLFTPLGRRLQPRPASAEPPSGPQNNPS